MTSEDIEGIANPGKFSVQPVRPADADDLALAMMSAFYEDPLWQSLWSGSMTLDQIVHDCAARLPWNLVKSDALRKRFQKVIENSSERAVGYARWCLPASRASLDTWPATIPPEVTQEERSSYEDRHQFTLDDNGVYQGYNQHIGAALSGPVEDAEGKILERDGDMMGIFSPNCHMLQY